MSQTAADVKQAKSTPQSRRDAIVYGAMTMISIAAGVAVHLHAGLPGPIAAVSGLTVLVALVSSHLLVTFASEGRRTGGKDRPARKRRPPARAEPNLQAFALDAGTTPAAEPTMANVPIATGVPASAPIAPASQLTPATASTPAPTEEGGVSLAVISHIIEQLELEARHPAPVEQRPAYSPDDERTTAIYAAPEAQRDYAPPPLPQASVAGVDEQLISLSVERLRSTAAMMSSDAPTADTWPAAPLLPIPSDQEFASGNALQTTSDGGPLAEIAEAIQGERLSIAREAIVGLNVGQPLHHELAVKLHLRSGEARLPEGIEALAGDTPLMPLLEALGVARAVRASRELQEPGAGAVFTRVTIGALGSSRVIDTLTSGLGQGMPAAAVVLSFRARELRNLDQQQWATLADLSDLGFRFAVQELSDLDLDFQLLCNVGFGFVKVDAGTFLQGLPAGGQFASANEIVHVIRQFGLRLIVSEIDDATALSRISALGVDYGMGHIFQTETRPGRVAA